jgi:hypothetical protein
MNNLMIHLKLLEQQDQANPKTNRWEEIIKVGEKSMNWRPKE